MWILYLTILFSLIALYLYNRVQKGKNRVYHIRTLKPIRSISWWRVLKGFFVSTRADRLTKGVNELIEASNEAEDPMFLSWLFMTPIVIVTDLEANASVLKMYDVFQKYTVTLSGLADRLFGKEGLVSANGDVWKGHRRLLNVPFVKNHIFFEPLDEVISDFVSLVIDPLDSEKNASCFGKHFQSLTLDSLGVSVLGKQFGLIKGNTNTPMTDYEIAVVKVIEPVRMLPFSSFLPGHKSTEDHVNNFENFITDLMAEEKADYDKSSILGTLLESYKAGEVTAEMVRNNIVTFFVAGHETTANELMFVFYYLAAYPELQEKVRQNVLDVIGESGYNYESIKSMKYLNNFLEEVYRMEPTVPMMGLRVTTEDIELADYFIPKGTIVQPTIKWNQMNPKIWDNPKEFNPDRMDKLTKEQKKSLILFSTGPRICIGKEFSILEQKMLICTVLQNYKVHMTSDSKLNASASFLVHPEDSSLKFYFTKLQ